MVRSYVEEICEILDIDAPGIFYMCDKSMDGADVYYYEPGDKLIVRAGIDQDLEKGMFHVAQELRHLWQLTYYREDYYQDIPDPDTSLSAAVTEDGLIDGIAFAGLMQIRLLHSVPEYGDIDEEMSELIRERMNQIEDELQE